MVAKKKAKEVETVKCEDCDGHGEQECGCCYGSGYESCETCDGHGEVEIEVEK